MSKIPQGEWSAIAARYAQGESISRIALSYGCTPPAIHYILKRNRQRTASDATPPVDRRPQPQAMPETAVASARPETTGPPPNDEGRHSPLPTEARLDAPPPVGARPEHERRPQALGSGQVDEARPRFLRSAPLGSRERAAMGLDRDLHCRAEAAIEAFRSSFDAALAEGSPGVRQQLRQAAADLMRVAARTTIVLDQLNARAERQETGRI